MNLPRMLEDAVRTWPGVSTRPHRFGGTEFQFGDAEIGHVHTNGMVDIPFPRSVRNALLGDGLAEEHHWVPNSGWITFRMRGEGELSHALWLLRLSYLRYVLKVASDPHSLLEQGTEELHLNAKFKRLLEPFMRRTADIRTPNSKENGDTAAHPA